MLPSTRREGLAGLVPTLGDGVWQIITELRSLEDKNSTCPRSGRVNPTEESLGFFRARL